ncbi:MAG: tetratricopeptide repeat protein, partial [Selenomonadaceae bacterium]|nr:tetratricopeptide repeat protein [Selenomonadaceae bacterium]
MKRFSFVLSIMFFVNVFVSVVHAEIQTYTGVGEYITDGSDTPDFAQTNARLYAERNVCEQAGVFISSRTEVKNSITERDEIEAFTVDIIRVKSDNVEVIPLTGAAKGFTKYRVTVTAEVDTSQFAARIRQWANRSEEERQKLVNQTVSMQRIIDSQRQQIAKLEKELQNIRTAQDRQRVTNEITNVKQMALYSQKMREAGLSNNTADKVRLYTEAIKINPNGAEAYFWRALNVENRQQEIADLSRAIEIDPNYAVAYYFRGSRYYLDDDYELALADFTKAIELNPNYVDAYRKRIKIYRKFDNNE